MAAAVNVQVLNTAPGGGGAPLVINGAERFQTMDGFGVSANSASWNDGELIPAIDLLIDENGSSLWRVILENADWEAVNDNADPNVFNWTAYNALYSTPRFEELWSTMGYLNRRGITANLILNFMGPGPAWMGGSSLAANAEDEWVEMVASVAYYARNTRGLKFGVFSPSNEPDWDGIEGIRMDQWQWARVMNKLVAKLDATGLGNLRILGPDTASIATGVNAYLPAMMQYPALMAKVGQYGLHNYAGDSGGADRVIRSSAYPAKSFWITEYSNIWDGFAHLTQGASALLVWDGFDSVYNHAILAGRGATAPNDAGNGPALLTYEGGKYQPRKAFYEAMHLFKFVPAGSLRIGATESNADVTVLAFHDPATGRVTLVGRNTGGDTVNFSAMLSNLPAVPSFELYVTDPSVNMQRRPDVTVNGGGATFTVPPFSVFTLTYPGAAGAPLRRQPSSR